MTIEEKLNTLTMQARLSTLWIFVFLNMIFRDLHEFGREGFLEEMLTGVINEVQLTEELFLISGFVLEFQIGMVILSRVLPYRYNRWANIIIALILVLVIPSFGLNDMDDIFFYIMEAIGLLAIAWSAWRWRVADVAKSVRLAT